MQTKIHFTTLVMLAHEMGQDRKAFRMIEATDLEVTEADMDDDLSILISQLGNCVYVPAGFGMMLLQNAYTTGVN